ncbi:hypothetical protein [Phycicoccus avicenniae]|uniref:hypothetical protein n=1 Tax=Phycicoccus avicenniae TaxID=2828860 RepID=UPI003D28056E
MTLVVLLLVAAVVLWPPGAPDPDPVGAALPAFPRGARSGWSGWGLRRAGPGRRGEPEWVAELAELTAVGLRAGLGLGGAAAVAAGSPAVRAGAPWLAERLAPAAVDGSGVAGCLAEPPPDVARAHRADLEVLGRAWRLSEDAGVAASRTTAGAAAAIRGRVAARERVGAALAGPRASMALLTALPLAGPFVGLLLGVSPSALYGSVPARAAAVLGVLLTVAGWAWGRRLVRRSLRPARTDGSP